jgi:beta-glucosidase
LEDFYTTQKTHPDAMSAAVDAVNHGVDMDCWGRTLSELVGAVKQGKVTEEQIDISVKRLFEIRFRLGMFDPKELTSFAYIDSTVISNDLHKAHALKMAQQSMVLLKNDGTLPLRKASLKKIAVVGPNVDNPLVQLGEYNGLPDKIITPLDGLKDKLKGVEIVYEPGCGYTNNDFPLDINFKDYIVSPNGFSVQFYNNTNLEGTPVYQGYAPEINFLSGLEGNPVAKGVNLTNFSSRFEGVLLAPVSGTIEFTIRFDDGYRFYVNDKIISAQWDTRTQSSTICRIELTKGEKYKLKLEQVQWGGGALIGLEGRFMERRPAQAVAEKVKDADVIIFVGGITPTLEREEIFDGVDRSAKDKVASFDPPGFYGGDRTSILLPQIQTNLLKELKATGKPVVLVLMSGSTIAVPWESENINAIIEAWYGGQSAGTAIADILFGDCNPSGHLPVTCYASDNDLPDFEDYNMENRTYKYFKGKPLYPFGFGLSYTDFAYNWTSQPKKKYKIGDTITCTVKVKNTGKTDGDAVSQAYIKYPDGKGLPLKELRFFERKTISQGDSYLMKVKIPVEQLAKWDEAAGKLVVSTGKYTLFLGTHSDDEAVTATFEIIN